MNPMVDELIASLSTDQTSENLGRWSARIRQSQTPLQELLPVLEADGKVPMYFTWLLGSIVEKTPKMFVPVLPELFARLDTVSIQGYRRSVSKWMYHAGLPEGREGEALDALFTWARDPEAQISTRRFALLGLCQLVTDFPDLVTEVRLVLEEQQEMYSPSFRKQVGKMLNGLEG